MDPSHYKKELTTQFEYLDGFIKELNKKGISDDTRTAVSFFNV